MQKVLVLCTGNSCRSVMGEALINSLGNGRYEAFSAGSHPTGVVHPLAIATLERNGIPVVDARSKSWNEFKDVKLDVVITVCDRARDENCPYFAGVEKQIHCGVCDPAEVTGDSEEIERTFQAVFEELRAKIIEALNLVNSPCST